MLIFPKGLDFLQQSPNFNHGDDCHQHPKECSNNNKNYKQPIDVTGTMNHSNNRWSMKEELVSNKYKNYCKFNVTKTSKLVKTVWNCSGYDLEKIEVSQSA